MPATPLRRLLSVAVLMARHPGVPDDPRLRIFLGPEGMEGQGRRAEGAREEPGLEVREEMRGQEAGTAPRGVRGGGRVRTVIEDGRGHDLAELLRGPGGGVR